MKIILGASGQVGSSVVTNLIKAGQEVKAVVRNEKKGEKLKKKGAWVAVADAQDLHSLIPAFTDGDTLFALTPESGKASNILGETEELLENYRRALASSTIKKVVGLSSIGAQFEEGTGNREMSYMLEHAFAGQPVETVFIRPAYYFSNWMPYLPVVKETGILPTFFPVDLSIPMVSPEDVAKLVATTMTDDSANGKIYELTGPANYSSADVAEALSHSLGLKVKAKQIPRDQWENKLSELGFSADGINNFIKMTNVVIAGKALPEGNGTTAVKGKTTLLQYIEKATKEKVTSPSL
jgi:uncharacterized protein YbjT (DUF2867 family)